MSQQPPSPNSEPPTPPKPPAQRDASVLERLQALAVTLKTLWQKYQPIVVTRSRQAWQLTVAAIRRFSAWWEAAIPKIRRILPNTWNEKLSDRALNAIAIGLVLLLLWLTPGFLVGKSAKVASQPAGQSQSEPAAPPAPAELAPDPALVAAIQTQVTEAMNQYAEGLIQSVRANFRQGRLLVRFGGSWSDLSPDRQDQVANELLRRSRQLKFEKVIVTDREGTLLARSPVVGSNMVLLQRQAAADPEPEPAPELPDLKLPEAVLSPEAES